MKKAIIGLYDTFRESCRKQRKHLAFLQLTGAIEQYLVKEFVYHIHKERKGELFGLTDFSNKRWDIAVCHKKNGKNNENKIIGILEAKYIDSVNKSIVLGKYRRNGESVINKALTKLNKQMKEPINRKYMKANEVTIDLNAKTKCIYGLVFASYVDDKKLKKGQQDKFFNLIKKKSKLSRKFKFHDLPDPQLQKVYTDERVKIFGKFYYATLRVGLWSLNQK